MTELTEDPLDAIAEDFLTRFRRGERPALDEYTDRHPKLAARIRELFPALVELEELGSALGPAQAPPRVPVPKKLGEYRILREIGRGGMAIVYEAVQESLGRQVALKVLPAGPHTPESMIERFRREARLAAKLHHGSIVPVYGVGTDQNVYYFAMQFIEGEGLDAILRETKRLRNSPTVADNSTITEGSQPRSESAATWSSLDSQAFQKNVARLGIAAAEALEHAHLQSIFHRDIKPSNLMLDTKGHLWITDFGLAKSEESDDLTRTGDFIGTWRFMAPEQFDNQADARSDIYSLGVTLYELLTGEPAFPGANRAAVAKAIQQGNHWPIQHHTPTIANDLATIIQKAMAVEPNRRYLSAGTLADDLRRYVNGEPVHARSPSGVERATKWMRRNPAWASVLAVSTLALLALIGVIGTYNWHLRTALADAKKNLTEADAQSQRANRNLESLNDAINQFAKLLRDDRALQSVDLAPTRKKLYQTAVVFYEQIIDQLGEREDLLLAQARAYRQLAYLIAIMDREEESRQYNEKAIVCFEKLIGQNPNVSEYYFGLCGCIHNLAISCRRHDLRRKVSEYFHQAIAVAERGLAVAPGNPDLRWFLSKHLEGLGQNHLVERQLPEAEALAQRSVEVARLLVADRPNSPDYRVSLLIAQRLVARVADRRGQNDAARSASQLAVDWGREALLAFPTVPDVQSALAMALETQANLKQRDRRWEQAKALNLEAIQLWERLLEVYPTRITFQGEILGGYSQLGELEHEMRDFNEAMKWHDKAIDHIDRLDLRGNMQSWMQNSIGRAFRSRAVTLKSMQINDQAECNYEIALSHCTNEEDRIETLNGLAHAQWRLERIAEAERSYRKSIAVVAKQLGREPNDPKFRHNLVPPLFQLGELYLENHRYQEGIVCLATSVAVREKLCRDRPTSISDARLLIQVYADTASIFSVVHLDDMAIRWADRALLAMDEFAKKHNDPEFIRDRRVFVLNARAAANVHAGRNTEAQVDRAAIQRYSASKN